MYRLSLNDNAGDTVSTRDAMFATEGGAIIAGVAEVKAGCPYHLYIEETDKPRSHRYARFIPNTKVKQFLDAACGDVLKAANALNKEGKLE